MVVILLTSGFAILLMGSALITYELVTFRSALTNNIEVLRKSSAPTVRPRSLSTTGKTPTKILRALAAENQITEPRIYDRNGRLFASFPESITPTQLPTGPARTAIDLSDPSSSWYADLPGRCTTRNDLFPGRSRPDVSAAQGLWHSTLRCQRLFVSCAIGIVRRASTRNFFANS